MLVTVLAKTGHLRCQYLESLGVAVLNVIIIVVEELRNKQVSNHGA